MLEEDAQSSGEMLERAARQLGRQQQRVLRGGDIQVESSVSQVRVDGRGRKGTPWLEGSVGSIGKECSGVRSVELAATSLGRSPRSSTHLSCDPG